MMQETYIRWYSDDIISLCFQTTRGNHDNWFRTNQPEHEAHEADDRAGDLCVCYQWERYGTSAANLTNIYHCIVMQ